MSDPSGAAIMSPHGYPYCNMRRRLCLCDRPVGHDHDGDQHECRCGTRWRAEPVAADPAPPSPDTATL